MKAINQQYQTLLLMVSAMHDYLVKLEQEALHENYSEIQHCEIQHCEIANKLSAARLKLLELKGISEKIIPNSNAAKLNKAG
jgi:hypothetical protein